MKLLVALTSSFFLIACHINEIKEKNIAGISEIRYARTLDVHSYKDFSIFRISKPWQKSENENFSYLIAERDFLIPDSLAHLTLIRSPVKSVVSFSTTHIGFISALNKIESIKGISGKNYFYDSLLRRNFNAGNVYDVGFPPTIDYEQIVKLKPDIVFLYGLGASEAAIINRLAEANIPTIMVSEFLEDHPLGKAEWIKLFACLYGLSDMGDSIFNSVSDNYNNLALKVGKISTKPKVLTGLPWKGTWYMAGGNSFTAKLIEDAGGDYLWKDNSSEEFIPLSLEAVFSRAVSADIWVNSGSAGSLSDLISRDIRFGEIKAVENKAVYNNNARLNSSGGNDFWESGALRADLILRDLISAFHPGLLEENDLVYYRKLE